PQRLDPLQSEVLQSRAPPSGEICAKETAAAAAGKALRGGRSSSTSNLLREISQRVQQEGMLPKLAGSSPANLSGARPIHMEGMLPKLVGSSPANLSGARPIHMGMLGKSFFVRKLSSMTRKVLEGPPYHSPESVIRHLNERINTIESYAALSRRLCFAALMTLVAGGVMVSPLLLDYLRLKKIEDEVRELRASVAEAQVRSHNLDIALHGT
ncbi:unnamed protein product, partial [Urochloa humidicola]